MLLCSTTDEVDFDTLHATEAKGTRAERDRHPPGRTRLVRPQNLRHGSFHSTDGRSWRTSTHVHRYPTYLQKKRAQAAMWWSNKNGRSVFLLAAVATDP